MPLDPRIPLMGNIYQPDFGEIAQNRAQSMNVLSQMRQRDQELAQQNQLAEYIKGGGDPMKAGIYGKQGIEMAELEMRRRDLGLRESEAEAKAAAAKQAQQEKIFGTSLMRAYADPSDANLDERFADMEVAGIDTSAFRQMIGQVPDPAARKKYLDDFLNTTEEGRVFMDRFVSKPAERDLGGRIEIYESNTNRDDAGKVIETRTKYVSPDQASRERIERAKLEDKSAGGAAPESLSAAGEKAVIDTANQIDRSTSAIDNLTALLAVNKDTGRSLLEETVSGALNAGLSAAAAGINMTTRGAKAQAQVEPLADAVIKNVPRFEGPQSDKDTASYIAAAGRLTDPLSTTEMKVAAAKTLLELSKKAKEQQQTRLQELKRGPLAVGTGAGAGAGTGLPTDIEDLVNQYAPQK